MKSISIALSCMLFMGLQACKLTDVTDLKPENKLDESTVVVDIPSAEKLLAGTYYSLRDEPLANQTPIYVGLMGLNVTASGTASNPYLTNNVPPNNSSLNSYLYGGPYQLIQTANFVILKTGALTITDPRKAQIIAEAKFLRAMGHFYILRLFGQFWDATSSYGIEIKNVPNSPVAARAGVKASYEFILEDLDVAIRDCPEYKIGVMKGYATKLAAKALKARVLLYQKDYAGAALLAKEVMSGPAVLSGDFVNLFTKEKYNSDEVLLASITFANNNNIYYENGKSYYWTYGGFKFTDRYAELLRQDTRKSIIVRTPRDPVDVLKWRGNGKFSTGVEGSQNDTEYYLRLSEAYLIYAEAEARRPGGNLADALRALNTLHMKRGNPELTVSGQQELLSLIRKEKELELGAESGEDWYDIVRYIKSGNLQASAVKQSLTDENKLILPIPQVSVDASNNLIKQNPGY